MTLQTQGVADHSIKGRQTKKPRPPAGDQGKSKSASRAYCKSWKRSL